jgi:hypothetical protein
MGMVSPIMMGVGMLGNMVGNHMTQQAEEQAIRLKLQQERASQTVRSTQRTQKINEIMATQTASLGARGVGGGSPSAFAVSMDSINKYAFDENADAMNLNFESISAENQIANSKSKAFFGDLNAVVGAGQGIYEGQYSSKQPNKYKSTKTG